VTRDNVMRRAAAANDKSLHSSPERESPRGGRRDEPTLSKQLAAFTAGLTYEGIPSRVVRAAKLHVLDLVGVALAAYGIDAATYAALATADLGGVGDASVIGQTDGRPAAVAALANGTLAHAIEFDDTHTGGIAHISAVVVPASLAVAEADQHSGRELLCAVVAGTEVTARIAIAAAPAYMKVGFHPTSVCGVFGAAAAACKLRGLDEPATANAFGIVGSFASGLFEYLGDGTTTKAVHAGWAAHAGIVAATLAQFGGDGPSEVLEGRFGLFPTYFGLNEPDLGADWDLGTRWETAGQALKPYPACHFINGALDAGRTMLALGLDYHQVEQIVVAVPEPAVPLVLEPRAHKLRPRTPFEAKFSLPFSLASLLVHGQVNVETYALERLEDREVLCLARQIHHEIEEFEHYPRVLPTRVNAYMRDGTVLTELSPKSAQPRPITAEETRSKFRRNVALSLEDAQADHLENELVGLEKSGDLRASLAVLRQARRRRSAMASD